jgi:outer membrane protein OmpA-like peptidoglycan-associated protein
MSMNLLSLAQNALGSDFAGLAGKYLGESPGATQSALNSLVPAVLGTLAQKGSTTEGAAGLMSMLNNANLDTGALGNISSLFGGGSGSGGLDSLIKLGTSTLLPALFGDKTGSLTNALSSSSGIKSSSATNLLAVVVPLILTFLKKLIGEKGLNAGSLASMFSSQGPNLQGALDSKITSALGFASPSAFLGSIGGAAADTARRAGSAIAGGAAAVGSAGAAAGTAAAAATTSGFRRILPWLIGLVVLGLLWWLFAPKTPAPVPAPKTAPAPAMAPAPAAPAPAAFAGLPAKVYFETGSATIGPDGQKIVTAAADAIKKDNLKVALTGYTDRTGDATKNEELAKSRATAVRDALKAAGVPEASMEMKAPIFVEIGVGMSDAEARRVEISKP